jgi:Protein of unknown function (DUF2442)
MSTLEIDVGDLRARAVEFTATELVVTLVDGRRIATPLEWYPRLNRASAAQRANFEIMPMGIHWPDLDEDLGIVGMLEGRRAAPGLRDRDVPRHKSRTLATEYRRREGSDTWHWCRNCSTAPKSDYRTRKTRPSENLCNECKAKERAGNCS